MYVNYDLFRTFFLNHFTTISYSSPVNWWNVFINRLEAILFGSQYSISNSRNGFFTSNIFDGIINHLSFSKVMKFWIIVLIDCCGYPVFVVFCFYCSDSDFELWCYFSRSMQIPWNDVLLISFWNFRNPGYSFLIFFSIYLCCYYTFIVQNNFCV